jgi:hypothetical protein
MTASILIFPERRRAASVLPAPAPKRQQRQRHPVLGLPFVADLPCPEWKRSRRRCFW